MTTGNDRCVWYAAYGSNMLQERFLCYIRGGKFRENGKTYDGCADKTPPRDKKKIILPHDMYYANHSSSWGGMGVSFLDVGKPGRAYGVAWLVTEEQFNAIHEQEGNISNWYNCVRELNLPGGMSAKTITNSRVLPPVSPCQDYLNVLREGLQENYPELRDEEIDEYLNSRNAERGR
jgi:hypothetical protein